MNDSWPLTPMEWQVVKAICAGHTTRKDLARHFIVSEHTVRTHLRRIHDKMKATNTAQIVVMVARNPEVHKQCFPIH